MPIPDSQDVQIWLDSFATAASTGDGEAMSRLFTEDGFWRDYLPFGWTLQTLEGREQITNFAQQYAMQAGFSYPVFEGTQADGEGFFRFQTKDGKGRGYVRLKNGKCETIFTMLESLNASASQPSNDHGDPFVLIIGGGQGGLALGAQLSDLDVPYLIIDKHPSVGDQWRSRYDSLVLHDPVWYDHMPFKPFPEDWPVFTPKDQMGDWLDMYASDLSLNIWASTELVCATFDQSHGKWSAKLNRKGVDQELTPTHLVFATGLSGFPKVPEFSGQECFLGPQLHSSEYKDGTQYAGQTVIVVGANNSAHDIATDLVKHGAEPIMIQRSSTHVVRQDVFCERLLGSLYSAEAVAAGITTDKADILHASMPLRLLEPLQRKTWNSIREEESGFYQKLTDAGFSLDFAEDGTGLGMKYRRTASGYYIDVGGSRLVIDGRIGIRSGCEVDHISKSAVHLDTGEALAADAIIYATGYGNMTDWIATLIDEETAERVGPCWGYGSDTKGDPGPWIGELRNMWVPTAQKGLWFTGGNLSQARFYSRLLGLQLAKCFNNENRNG